VIPSIKSSFFIAVSATGIIGISLGLYNLVY
jgi:hypothetical protein